MNCVFLLTIRDKNWIIIVIYLHKNLFSQNKGNNECVSSFIRSVNSNAPSPIDHDELIEVAKFTIEAGEKLRT